MSAAAVRLPRPLRVLLVSTYDLGRQPFGLASPAAWLRAAGADGRCLDLAVEALDEGAVRWAEYVAFHVPMHTATRLTLRQLPRVRALNPAARIAAYGLYAPLNAEHLRAHGVDDVLGGEFEALLLDRVASAAAGAPATSNAATSLDKLPFVTPDRAGLPPLDRYASLVMPDGEVRVVGATEASRGCKHRCRHCPIVPVYNGRFRVVPRDVVLADVRRQVEAGARHVTFGDPDFWNAIGHAMPLVRALHAEFPELSYDVTIKVEHLKRHAEHLPELRDTGCALVTTAVESVDDTILATLEKGHTRADFEWVVTACRSAGLALQPTFVPFTPWTTPAGYRELLAAVRDLGLVEHVPPIQLAIRLLVPAGSRLLEREDVRGWVRPFDPAALVHPWAHPDPEVDALHARVHARVHEAAAAGTRRAATFARVWREAWGAETVGEAEHFRRAPVPYLTEPWYC
jgi:radical SAM superfamily enzyme YgiQ (UPF0313 family)